MEMVDVDALVSKQDVLDAHDTLKSIVKHTPLEKDYYLSQKYDCNVYLKREDLQWVRSFKLRGAYYAIAQLTHDQLKKWCYMCQRRKPCTRSRLYMSKAWRACNDFHAHYNAPTKSVASEIFRW